jgi:hypothetical protein
MKFNIHNTLITAALAFTALTACSGAEGSSGTPSGDTWVWEDGNYLFFLNETPKEPVCGPEDCGDKKDAYFLIASGEQLNKLTFTFYLQKTKSAVKLRVKVDEASDTGERKMKFPNGTEVRYRVLKSWL